MACRRPGASSYCRSSSCRCVLVVAAGVGASIAGGSKYLLFLGLYDGVFTLLAWGSFDYVVAQS